MLCPIILKSNTIKLTVHTSCYCLELCVTLHRANMHPMLECLAFGYGNNLTSSFPGTFGG